MRLSSTESNSGAQPDADRTRRSDLILEAESNLHAGLPSEAFRILSDLDRLDEPYVRHLLIQAAEQSERWGELAGVLADPETGDERIQLVEALIQVGRVDDAMAHLGEHDRPPLADHVRRELRQRLEHLMAMRGRRE